MIWIYCRFQPALRPLCWNQVAVVLASSSSRIDQHQAKSSSTFECHGRWQCTSSRCTQGVPRMLCMKLSVLRAEPKTKGTASTLRPSSCPPPGTGHRVLPAPAASPSQPLAQAADLDVHPAQNMQVAQKQDTAHCRDGERLWIRRCPCCHW